MAKVPSSDSWLGDGDSLDPQRGDGLIQDIDNDTTTKGDALKVNTLGLNVDKPYKMDEWDGGIEPIEQPKRK